MGQWLGVPGSPSLKCRPVTCIIPIGPEAGRPGWCRSLAIVALQVDETNAIYFEPAGASCRVIREDAVLANVTIPATVEVDKEIIDDKGQTAKSDVLNRA